MIDDEEAVPNDGNTGDLSGEADVANLRLLGPGPNSTVRVYETPTGGVVQEISRPSMRNATAIDRVFFKIQMRKDQHDAREGYFRDYKDGTGRPSDSMNVIMATNQHEEAVKAVRISWRHKLDVALAFAYAETNEKKLADRLVEVSAVAMAWQEAIDLRGSKARILAEQGAVKHVQRADGTWKKVNLMPWWRRVLKALRLSQ